MKILWRFCSTVLLLLIVAANALPYVALAQTSASQTPPPTCVLSLNTGTIPPGGSVTLTWASVGATGGNITGVGPVGPAGSINLLPSAANSTTFYGTFSGAGGTAKCQVTVVVSYDAPTSGGATSNPVNVGSATGFTAPTPTPTQATAPATQSQNGGLVPCGLTSNFMVATNCQACNLAQLVSYLINFTIGIAIPIAAALFAWAGILYFTSAENPGNVAKAKGIFKNALLGFLIAITGWLVVNTILQTVLSAAQFPQGSWFSVSCTLDTSRVRDSSIGNWLSSLPLVNNGSSGNTLTPGQQGGLANSQAIQDANLQAQQSLSDACTGFADQASCIALKTPVNTNGTLTDAQYYALSDLCDSTNDPNSSSCKALDKVDAVANLTPGPTYDQSAAGQQVSQFCQQSGNANCITLQSSGSCSDQSKSNCTSLTGVQQSTIAGAESMQQQCGCNLTITGGTEVGHSESGWYTHSNGYKLDFDPSSQLSTYITTNGAPIGNRTSDNAPQYQMGQTICARESNHWDCTFYGS